MRREIEIRRRLVYLMQQKGYLLQQSVDSKELLEVLKEIEVLQWILNMED